MEEFLHHLKSVKSWELQYFRAPRWCKMSSLNPKRNSRVQDPGFRICTAELRVVAEVLVST